MKAKEKKEYIQLLQKIVDAAGIPQKYWGYNFLKHPITAKLPEPESPEYEAMQREIEKWAHDLYRPVYVADKNGKRKRVNPHPRWTRFWLKLGNRIDFFLRLRYQIRRRKALKFLRWLGFTVPEE